MTIIPVMSNPADGRHLAITDGVPHDLRDDNHHRTRRSGEHRKVNARCQGQADGLSSPCTRTTDRGLRNHCRVEIKGAVRSLRHPAPGTRDPRDRRGCGRRGRRPRRGLRGGGRARPEPALHERRRAARWATVLGRGGSSSWMSAPWTTAWSHVLIAPRGWGSVVVELVPVRKASRSAPKPVR